MILFSYLFNEIIHLLTTGAEAIHPQTRIKYTFGVSAFQSIGNLVMALIAYSTRKWFDLQLYFFCPILLIVTYSV